MKVTPANPLRKLHVLTLLSRTCLLLHPLTATTTNLFNNYKFKTHATRVTRAITVQPHAHSHRESSNREIESKMEENGAIEEQSKFRSEFLQILRSRRPPQGGTIPRSRSLCTGCAFNDSLIFFSSRYEIGLLYMFVSVPLPVQVAKPVVHSSPPSTDEEIMKSCPKKDIENFNDLLKEENLYLTIEEGDQGRLPVLILSLKESDKQTRRPAIVFLHSTNKYKEYLRPLLEAYASRGYIAISVDSRYHGERAKDATTYRDALISAWKTGDTMPFIYDTVWDLIKLADYLTEREDIDASRIGITGISLGGMHAWFAAAADTRYAVVAPLIGVQGFRWAIDNDKWQARVDSIKPVFEVARDDLGKSAIDKEVVEKVWDRIAPGLASQFDSPYSIPSIAPRPLLILNGAEDPRCPLAGLEIPRAKASQAYRNFDRVDIFQFIAEPGIGHQITKFMVKESSDWFDKFLKPQLMPGL